MKKKPNHCWHCGRKLQGNHFIESYAEGYKRIFHKSCLKAYERCKYNEEAFLEDANREMFGDDCEIDPDMGVHEIYQRED